MKWEHTHIRHSLCSSEIMCGATFLNPVRLWIMQFLCKVYNKSAMENHFCFIFMVIRPFFAKNVMMWLWVTFSEFIIRNVATTKSTV